ncbi:MAG: SRPBCC family protein, partial [Chloroflexi bacterium]|nr:SRPBCC family protein [Chloroflexota bacterium]
MTTFEPRRATRTASIRLNGSPDRVFPLFTPLGERQWAEGWEPIPIYPASGEAEPGAVFSTRHGDGPPTIWTVTVFDPHARRISYVRVAPGSLHVAVDVRCVADGPNGTHATVTYTYTGLSDRGNESIDAMTEEA